MNVKRESDNVQPDLAKICRLCLTEEAGSICIFDANERTNIALEIMACTAIEMHAADSLPKQICRDCRIQLERSYYFRKRSQIADAKLRKHIRMLNAGKTSKVFKPKSEEDEDDDDDELKDSLNFLKQIEKEEEAKQQQRQAELEETLRQKFREEEMDRIFNEAKNFFSNKISNKVKKSSSFDANEIKEAVPSTSKSVEEKRVVESTDPVYENVVDSTEMSYNENDKEQSLNENPCFVVKMPGDNETEYEIHEGESSDQQMDKLEFTVVKLEVDKTGSMNFEALNFEQIDNSEADMEPDSDGYHEENVSMIGDENSDSSNAHLYTITNLGDGEHDPDNPNEEIVIGLSNKEDHNESSEQFEDDEMEIKSPEFIEMGQLIQKIPNKKRQSDLFEVNNPQNIEELKVFKCLECPQAFTRHAQLIRHGANHEKERRFQCEHCKKLFACKSSLDRHRRIHSGEKPFECAVCNRRFIQKEILKRHLYIHTGEKPYHCQHCNKSFVQRQMLAQHINLKHTDNPVVQMHECFLCPKSFCHASGLSRHLLTHSGVTYTCTKCGKKFSDKSAVKRHMSSVH